MKVTSPEVRQMSLHDLERNQISHDGEDFWLGTSEGVLHVNSGLHFRKDELGSTVRFVQLVKSITIEAE